MQVALGLASWEAFWLHDPIWAMLEQVDRSRTPWLVVGMHVPWYNSYHSHHGEGDAIRDALEELLFQNGVDLIFAGHVHSYERSRRVLRGQPDPCGPIHVTIGDGGNREGAAIGWEEPQPEWSEVGTPGVFCAARAIAKCASMILSFGRASLRSSPVL